MYNWGLLSPLLLLSSCQFSGAFAVHNPTADSEFEEERVIARIEASQELSENAEFYISHESQPLYKEDGNGVNSLGFRVKVKVY